MKFNIKINKSACFYFFIQNLSEWHFSNRKNYNLIWRQELGIFSQEEESALQDFKFIREKYGWSKPGFESIFYTTQNPLEDISKIISKKERDDLKNVFEIFNQKFDKLYEKEKNSLQNWQLQLDKKINDESKTKNISKTLSVLYNAPIPNKDINVYLLPSSANTTGGGANIDEKSITVELSRYPIEGINHVIGIIWHETIHLLFEKVIFSKIIEQKYPQIKESEINFREITASMLFPKGVLAQKFLNTSIPAATYFGKYAKYSEEILNLMNEYISGNKTMDASYLEKLFSIITK